MRVRFMVDGYTEAELRAKAQAVLDAFSPGQDWTLDFDVTQARRPTDAELPWPMHGNVDAHTPE